MNIKEFKNLVEELKLEGKKEDAFVCSGYSVGEIGRRFYGWTDLKKDGVSYIIYFDNMIDNAPKIIILNTKTFVTTILRFNKELKNNILEYIMEENNNNKYFVRNPEIQSEFFAYTKSIYKNETLTKRFDSLETYCKEHIYSSNGKPIPYDEYIKNKEKLRELTSENTPKIKDLNGKADTPEAKITTDERKNSLHTEEIKINPMKLNDAMGVGTSTVLIEEDNLDDAFEKMIEERERLEEERVKAEKKKQDAEKPKTSPEPKSTKANNK